MSRPATPLRIDALWVLPLCAGLLPASAALAALWLSIDMGLLPACNPFIDGCASVSRAGRYDLPNHLFRALVLPAAALQWLTWMLCASWLRDIGAEGMRLPRVLPWLGALCAVFLILYGTFLGTDGAEYRWMRRYGVVFYFGFTFLCMLITSGTLWRLTREGRFRLPVRLDLVLLSLCALTLLAGLLQVYTPPFTGDEGFRDRLRNMLEWHTGLAFTLFFFALAWLWRYARYSAMLVNRRLLE